jgi:hypothetical protein
LLNSFSMPALNDLGTEKSPAMQGSYGRIPSQALVDIVNGKNPRESNAARSSYSEHMKYYLGLNQIRGVNPDVLLTIDGFNGYVKGINMEPSGLSKEQVSQIDPLKWHSSKLKDPVLDMIRGYQLGFMVGMFHEYKTPIAPKAVPLDDESHKELQSMFEGLTDDQKRDILINFSASSSNSRLQKRA